MDGAALMLLWTVAALGWGLAAAGGWTAWHWMREVERQRRLRSVADYAAHKAEQRIVQLQAERDALIVRLARKQDSTEQIVEAAIGIAKLGQLADLYSDDEQAG